MSNNPITAADVAWAVNELESRQENPTAVRVRELLGRGSFTTINKHLKNQRGGQGAMDTPTPRLALPEPLQAAVAALHERLQEQAEEQISLAAEEAGQRVREAEERSALMVSQARDKQLAAEARLEEVKQHVTALEADIERLTLKNEALLLDRQAESAKTAQLDGQLLERQQRLDELREQRNASAGQLQQLQITHERQIRELRETHEGEEQRWQAFAHSQVDALSQRMDRERTEARAREAELANALRESARTNGTLETEVRRTKARIDSVPTQRNQRWRPSKHHRLR